MVKSIGNIEELIENWTLVPQELELVKKKVGAGQIGFAIFLAKTSDFAFLKTDPGPVGLESFLSEIAFAFTHLLGFQLMPRLKRIKVQKLYRPCTGQSTGDS